MYTLGTHRRPKRLQDDRFMRVQRCHSECCGAVAVAVAQGQTDRAARSFFRVPFCRNFRFEDVDFSQKGTTEF